MDMQERVESKMKDGIRVITKFSVESASPNFDLPSSYYISRCCKAPILGYIGSDGFICAHCRLELDMFTLYPMDDENHLIGLA